MTKTSCFLRSLRWLSKVLTHTQVLSRVQLTEFKTLACQFWMTSTTFCQSNLEIQINCTIWSQTLPFMRLLSWPTNAKTAPALLNKTGHHPLQLEGEMLLVLSTRSNTSTSCTLSTRKSKAHFTNCQHAWSTILTQWSVCSTSKSWE